VYVLVVLHGVVSTNDDLVQRVLVGVILTFMRFTI